MAPRHLLILEKNFGHWKSPKMQEPKSWKPRHLLILEINFKLEFGTLLILEKNFEGLELLNHHFQNLGTLLYPPLHKVFTGVPPFWEVVYRSISLLPSHSARALQGHPSFGKVTL